MEAQLDRRRDWLGRGGAIIVAWLGKRGAFSYTVRLRKQKRRVVFEGDFVWSAHEVKRRQIGYRITVLGRPGSTLHLVF